MKVLKVILLLFVTNLYAQDILLLKDRAKIIDKILKERIDNILPKIMNLKQFQLADMILVTFLSQFGIKKKYLINGKHFQII